MHTSHRRPIGVFILIEILTLLASACAADDPALETTAPTDDQARLLLGGLGMPFKSR